MSQAADQRTTLTRRDLMAVAGAVAVVPAAAGARVQSDPDLVFLWVERQALVRETAEPEPAPSDPGYDAWEARQTEIWDRADALDWRIAALPASSLSGLLIKLRIASEGCCRTPKTADHANLLAALADCERLARAAV